MALSLAEYLTHRPVNQQAVDTLKAEMLAAEVPAGGNPLAILVQK